MRSHEFINEIERMAARDYTGGKSYLERSFVPKTLRPLPGGSGLKYSIEDPQGNPVVKIWDPSVIQADPRPTKSPFEFRSEYQMRLQSWQDRRGSKQPGLPTLIGKLTLERAWFPLPGSLQVGTITVDEDYRGRGIAKALYGIVLTIMRRPLLAGESQTPGGRQNWVSLSQIPGVEMKGYVALDSEDLAADPDYHDPREINRVSQTIDTVMGKLGGEYIGNKSGREFFAFAVRPAATGRELEAYVNSNLSKIYHNNYMLNTGLYAQWTGS